MIYVMSDIHGCYDDFEKMLEKIKFSSKDKLYILGDVIDRGNKNLKMLNFCIDTPNVELIIGNHEFFMLTYLFNPNDYVYARQWDVWGGRNTLAEIKNEKIDEQLKLYNYLISLPFSKTITVNNQDFFLTHSGFNADIEPIKNEKGEVVLEKTIEKMMKANPFCYLVSSDLHYIPETIKFDKKIIVGHVPTIGKDFGENKGKIYKNERFIDIDCGACFRYAGGRLGCLRLDDMKEFYV